MARGTLFSRRAALGRVVALVTAPGVFVPLRAQAQGAAGSLAAVAIKRDLGRIARQTDRLLEDTVRDGLEKRDTAISRFQEQQQKISPELSNIFNERVKESEWSPLIEARQLELALAMQGLKVRLAPTPPEVNESINRKLPEINPQSQEDFYDVFLSIAMDTLGIKELAKVMVGVVLGDSTLANAMKLLQAALRAKNYAQAALELERMLTIMVSPSSIKLITSKIGVDATQKLLRGIAVRFVPFIGWAYLVSCLMVAIYHNRDKLAKYL